MNEITINSYLDILQNNESYLQEDKFFNEDKIKLAIKSYKKNIATAEKLLKDNGINVNEIKTKARSLAKSLSKEFKSGYKNKIPAKKLAEKITKKVGIEIKKNIIAAKKNITSDVGDSIALLIGLLFISVFIITIITIPIVLMGLGQNFILIITALIMAPILEEFFKRIAILEGYPWIYTGIFAGFEFIKYIVIGTMTGLSIIPFVMIRLAVVLMHFVTTSVQKYYNDKSKKENEQEQFFSTTSLNGYYIAVLIHFSWNLIMLIGNDFLKGFL